MPNASKMYLDDKLLILFFQNIPNLKACQIILLSNKGKNINYSTTLASGY